MAADATALRRILFYFIGKLLSFALNTSRFPMKLKTAGGTVRVPWQLFLLSNINQKNAPTCSRNSSAFSICGKCLDFFTTAVSIEGLVLQ